VSSGPLTNSGNRATVSMNSTSGVILWHKSLERLTLANHGFPTTEVYHPDTNGVIIAEITHRLPALDIALAKLYNPFRYTNTRYFEAPVPIRLLRHSEFGSEWCELDGMTTGVVFSSTHPCHLQLMAR
jgi:hypothetical protein